MRNFLRNEKLFEKIKQVRMIGSGARRGEEGVEGQRERLRKRLEK